MAYFDRTTAKAYGYTDQEINDFMSSMPQGGAAAVADPSKFLEDPEQMVRNDTAQMQQAQLQQAPAQNAFGLDSIFNGGGDGSVRQPTPQQGIQMGESFIPSIQPTVGGRKTFDPSIGQRIKLDANAINNVDMSFLTGRNDRIGSR